MTENCKRAPDKGEYVACISMDISKAFDCLTICKLFVYGLAMDACPLIASYLFRRKQRVKIGNIKSEWGEIDKDVSQGAIPGGGGALPPIAIRGCAALQDRFWKAGFPKIGCDFIKFP